MTKKSSLSTKLYLRLAQLFFPSLCDTCMLWVQVAKGNCYTLTDAYRAATMMGVLLNSDLEVLRMVYEDYEGRTKKED